MHGGTTALRFKENLIWIICVSRFLLLSLSQKTLGSAEVPTEFGGEGTLKNRDHQEVPPKGLRMMKFDKKWFVEYL